MEPRIEHVQKTSKKEELRIDAEIAVSDQAAYRELVKSILANKRLAWEIVDAWLRVNGKLLVKNPKGKRPFWWIEVDMIDPLVEAVDPLKELAPIGWPE